MVSTTGGIGREDGGMTDIHEKNKRWFTNLINSFKQDGIDDEQIFSLLVGELKARGFNEHHAYTIIKLYFMEVNKNDGRTDEEVY